MKRFLFVDDESQVLTGLQRLLRPMRHQCEMQFVTSGDEALTMLAQGPFHVVVSDMRMPGMDGATLLKEVQRRYPHIVRIVLSGHSDQAMIHQSRGVMHQYLAKPCEADVLKAILVCACTLYETLAQDSLRSLVAGLSSVPSLPAQCTQLKREMESENASLTAITAIISQDIGMTAKMLELANSSYPELRATVTTAEQAVNLPGFDTIQSLVQIGDGFSPLAITDSDRLNVEGVWAESLATGTLAQAIAQAEQASPPTIDQARAAGVLHEIGALVLAANATERYNAACRIERDRGIPRWEAEKQEFGNTHAEVGAYLLALWGINESIVEAVAFHHTPAEHAGEAFCPLTAVHVADNLQKEFRSTERGGTSSQLDIGYLERLGLGNRLPIWRELAAGLQKEYVHE